MLFRWGAALTPLLAENRAVQQPGNVLERVSDAFVALDRDWRYTYVNRQAAALFGRRPEDLIGRHIWTEFPEGVGQPFHLAYERAMAEQVSISMESYYEPWDRWFENRIYPSPDGVSIFFHEITERKRAEQAAHENAALLRDQNDVLARIAEGAPLGETLDLLLRRIEARSPGMLASILLLDPDGVSIRHGAAPSLPETFTRAVDGAAIGPRAGSCGTAAFRREPVIAEDIATDPLWDDYRALALHHGLRACWSTPIMDSSGGVLGTFALYFRTPGRPAERHRELIGMATTTAAIAIVTHRGTAALRASEERLRLAVSGGHIGIWEWNVGSDRLLWSDELKAMIGWPPDRPLVRPAFLQVMHPEDRSRVAAALERSLATRTDFDVEFRFVRPDGSLRWMASKAQGDYAESGQPVRVLGVAFEITDRKRAEEEAIRREAQLAEAQRIAHLGSYEWEVGTDTVYRSAELCRIFGVEPGGMEPTFDGYLARVHPDDRDATRATIQEAFRTGAPFDFDERIVRPDGTVRLLHSQGTWIVDAGGKPVKLVGICHDITERRRAEDQLRRSEERFQIVARATNDAIWDWDLGTGTVWWNQGVTTLFGYASADVGDDIEWKRERVHRDDVDRTAAGLRGAIDRGEHFWSGEYRFRRADGSFADVFDRAFVTYDAGGQPIRLIGAMADMSERKRAVELLEQRVTQRTAELVAANLELRHEISQRARAEEGLRAKNEELKAFAYTVSHDLKAPLRAIAGYAQELDRRHRTGLGDRALHCITQIVAAARNLDRLIEDLLQYARLDAAAPARTTVDLRKMVDGILKDRQSPIADEHVQMTVALHTGDVRTWERGVRQVLTNLIDNALKYSRNASPPRVCITSEERDGAVLIRVADNGIGFDMRYHDRMFGLFNRLVRQEEFDGTGAGLAIVRKIVDKLGGRIWGESVPGQGATFFVELPAAAAVSDGRPS
jgi:PAS domain S-box-containing protein